MKFGNYDFKQTCSVCPEQYDVFDEKGTQVAYVRLRWGSLYAECPDVGGTEVYYVGIGNDAGCFRSNNERIRHLKAISKRIELFNQPVICPHCGEQHTMNVYEFDGLINCGIVDIDCLECDQYFMARIVEDRIIVNKP